MIETRLFQQVVVLSEARSYAKAAKILRLSQPALSRSILQLESRIGQRLFDRSRRQIQLTEAGLLFVNRARDLLARGDDLEREVSLLNGSRGGQLTIGAGPYPAELILKPVLKTLLSGRPELRTRVGIDHWLSLVRQLRSGEFESGDCGIQRINRRTGSGNPPVDPSSGLFSGAGGAPTAEREGTNHTEGTAISSRRRFPFPIPDYGAYVARTAEIFIKPQVAVITDNLGFIREVVSGTDILGLFALSQVESELEKGKLAVIPCTAAWLHSQYGLITLKRHTVSPDEEAFIQLALEADGKIKRKEKELARKYLG